MDEVIAVIEIDVSDGGNHHTTGLGALDGLRAVVGQSVRGVIRQENPVWIAQSTCNCRHQQAGYEQNAQAEEITS